MNWFKRNWRKLVLGTCGVIGGAAVVVPVLIPAAAICALATPVILGGGTALDAIRAALRYPANVTPTKTTPPTVSSHK